MDPKFYIVKQTTDSVPEKCLVVKFFAKEAEKPIHLRQKICMISCPCSKCRPNFF